MKIKFTEKKVYGRPLFYPVCPISKMLCFVFMRKCLQPSHIERLKKLGWEVIREEI